MANISLKDYAITFCIRLPVVLCVLFITFPFIILALIIRFILFMVRLPFYLHHKSKYHWHHHPNHPSISSMDLASKVVYGGAYPFNKGANIYVHAGLYLNGNITKSELISKIGFFYDIPRFRYVPHWNHRDGIAEFCGENGINFDIEQHVDEITTTSSNLQYIMDSIRNKTLNRDIPWWDITIIHIENSTHSLKTIILLRWDHCLGDGITFLKHIAPKLLENKKGEKIDFGKYLKHRMKGKYIEFVKITIDSIYRSILFMLSRSDTNLPILNDMGCVHGETAFYHKKLDLNDVKKIYNLINNDIMIRNHFDIKNNHHVSMNDIFLSLSSGATRNALICEYYDKYNNNNDKLDELIYNINNGEFKSLLIACPPTVNNEVTFNNNYIPLSVPFNINIKDDIQRIIKTSESILPQKSGWNIFITTLLFQFVGFLSIDFVKIMNYRSVFAFSNHHSSLRGPSYPIYFNGNKLIDVSVHVGDTVKTPSIEILHFDDIASLNISVNKKYFKFAQLWGNKYQILIENILNQLMKIKNKHL